MEQLIEFFDFGTKPSGRGTHLKSNTVSVWYNLKHSCYNCTFSSDIKTDKACIKIGKLGSDLCFAFANEGIALRKSGKNIVFASRDFVEMVFGEIKNEKGRKVYNLKKINSEVYVLNPLNN
jgi:hypothetical protein